jgi:signal transduction histidine kinase
MRRSPGWIVLIAALFLTPFVAFFSVSHTTFAAPDEKLTPYVYEDTKLLVGLVEDAAALVEQKGSAAFSEFAVKGSRWQSGDLYIFVYEADGTLAFHPIEPQLIGKNLIDLHDMDGKPVIKMITDVANKPEKDADGWVFYLWEYKTQLTPMWKSSYVRKATAPDGRVYLVGAGLYNMKTEKVFVEDRVKLACDKVATEGAEQAFKEFRDPASPFVFLGAYVFVLDQYGRTIVDPSYPDKAGRDLSNFRDAVGFKAIDELMRKLADNDTAWVLYLWPKPGSALPSRKLIYARKIFVHDQIYIVGSDFYLATPIWIRV